MAFLTLFAHSLLIRDQCMPGPACVGAIAWWWARIAQLCRLLLTNDAGKRDFAHRDRALVGWLFRLAEDANGLLRSRFSLMHEIFSCADALSSHYTTLSRMSQCDRYEQVIVTEKGLWQI